MASAVIITVFAGFAPTFYLRGSSWINFSQALQRMVA
jgi:hypothetical protein